MRKWILAALGAAFLNLTAQAAELAITADVLTYEDATDTATATGNVVIERDGAHMTGAAGEYHFADRRATLTGGVHYAKGETRLSAEQVDSYADQSLRATGSVRITDRGRTLGGDVVTYRPTDGYGTITGNAAVTFDETSVTAAQMEAYLNEVRVIGEGGVTLNRAENELRASADRLVYTQRPDGSDGYAILEGNARAEQNGNTVSGPRLDVRVDEREVETKGRSTLVIRTGD